MAPWIAKAFRACYAFSMRRVAISQAGQTAGLASLLLAAIWILWTELRPPATVCRMSRVAVFNIVVLAIVVVAHATCDGGPAAGPQELLLLELHQRAGGWASRREALHNPKARGKPHQQGLVQMDSFAFLAFQAQRHGLVFVPQLVQLGLQVFHVQPSRGGFQLELGLLCAQSPRVALFQQHLPCAQRACAVTPCKA
jgi:hypothetical protein